jgi:radical SAM family uncharacterized protein/radical SAM-linked protein
MHPAVTPHPYAEFLHRVNKPARYTGGEVGSVVKEWTPEVAKVCLAFPDVYDIGMSHLGFRILYKVLNDDPRTLAERCYAPWVDMEAELRQRGLPLISLESRRPLRDFDVVGFSLQFELTYSNILTMLDLGGIPLRAADRGEDDPLVIAGGPVATHPEPIAPFLDAVVIGDGEEMATRVALTWTELKRAGVKRSQRLLAIARLGAVYVPSLYATRLEESIGLQVVAPPADPTLPFPVDRALVDLAKFPFPDDGPTGGPEAIFDRMSIEIARGCTEGCRFCQAGMIYRPVRERDPEEIVETVVRAVKKGGHEEVSLTALSTADVSCIAPLVKKVNDRLVGEKVSLGVASLRAYGLAPELLDELRRVRAVGLTFAPEAGTQRMRDVINKNVTDEQLMETAERVFSRGWGRMKLYFICGLPTETDEDVRGIVETGARALQIGKRAAGKGKPAEVTVSVSVHVPKPHTPFQWCAMDDLTTVDRKQRLMRDMARPVRGLKLKTHDAAAGVIEAIFARGDRPLADVLERAWRNGARFDSWDEQLKLDVWKEALAHFEIETADYLGTMPITARLPWSHIDVGLEDGFLAREYKKSLQSRLSPPCGKVAGQFVHHEHVAAAQAEERRLVCYDCGVACDMTQMREDRIAMLERLGAKGPEDFSPKRLLPVVRDGEEPPPQPTQRERTMPKGQRVRFRFEKLGGTALLGHLDLVREIPRIFRRVDLRVDYTKGFHAKPDMVFAPALGLGVSSLDELLDVRLLDALPPEGLDALCRAMTERAPHGLRFVEARALREGEPAISKVVRGARYAIVFGRRALEADISRGVRAEEYLAARIEEIVGATELHLKRDHSGIAKRLDVRPFLTALRPLDDEARAVIARAGFFGDLVGAVADVEMPGSGGIRPAEIAALLAGPPGEDGTLEAPPHQALRVALRIAAPAEAAASSVDPAALA